VSVATEAIDLGAAAPSEVTGLVDPADVTGWPPPAPDAAEGEDLETGPAAPEQAAPTGFPPVGRATAAPDDDAGEKPDPTPEGSTDRSAGESNGEAQGGTPHEVHVADSVESPDSWFAQGAGFSDDDFEAAFTAEEVLGPVPVPPPPRKIRPAPTMPEPVFGGPERPLSAPSLVDSATSVRVEWAPTRPITRPAAPESVVYPPLGPSGFPIVKPQPSAAQVPSARPAAKPPAKPIGPPPRDSQTGLAGDVPRASAPAFPPVPRAPGSRVRPPAVGSLSVPAGPPGPPALATGSGLASTPGPSPLPPTVASTPRPSRLVTPGGATSISGRGSTAGLAPVPVATDAPKVTRETPIDGTLLKRLRESRGWTVDDLMARTHISRRHIENIEGDQYDRLPPLVYLRGYLKTLAREYKVSDQIVTEGYLRTVARTKGGAE
jgi:hypothetical protein